MNHQSRFDAVYRMLGAGALGRPRGRVGEGGGSRVQDGERRYPGSIPGSGRSPGEGKGYPLQYSGLENSMDCIVHGVAKSRTRLSDVRFTTWKSSTNTACSLDT